MKINAKARITYAALTITIACLAILTFAKFSGVSFFPASQPGVVPFSEIPAPLQQAIAAMKNVGIRTDLIESFRVHGEYDLDYTTVCRIPYSQSSASFVIQELHLTPVDDPALLESTGKHLPSDWWPSKIRGSKKYVSEGFLSGAEGNHFCLTYSVGDENMFLYYEMNF